METDQIIDYLKNTSNQNLCGRFYQSQLKTYEATVVKKKKLNFLVGFGLAFLALFSGTIAQAQETKSQTNHATSEQSQVQNTVQEKSILVKGTVTESALPLPGVNVMLKGTTIGTTTDLDGNFVFPEKLKRGDILLFSFIGMETQHVVISDENSTSTVELKVDMSSDSSILMGKIAVKQVYRSGK
ncbi:MAG: carboxypeptidase-like regulatory domain-containing protein [Flavobacteriaceae bacterium]|nr:carboxypeptidase-like regulatory domain-containing protein [Flavobacteriaceae bacterium]